MSTENKMLIEFNDEYFSVFLESNDNLYPFKLVLDKISSQLDFNVSLKTHLFRVFDQKFETYVSIINEKQLIENFSRIRIESKDENKELNNNCLDLLGLNSNVSSVNQKLQKAMESFDLINFRSITKYENHKQFEEKKPLFDLSDGQIYMFKALIESMETIVRDFGPASVLSHFWELVANQMSNKGFFNSSGSFWRRIFTKYVNNFYGQVLIHALDYRNAKQMYPLFELIHSTDLSQFMAYSLYKKIENLRERFNRFNDNN